MKGPIGMTEGEMAKKQVYNDDKIQPMNDTAILEGRTGPVSEARAEPV